MRVSLDTNVLVRLVTEDDPAQARAARDHLEGKDLYLASSVACDHLVTFDRSLAATTGKLELATTVRLL
jgi:predicted nucleic-acid-binding protein